MALCSLRSAQCALLNERVASSIWSPTRSMVLYGPVFRRELRSSWLPLFGPLLGPWSFMVPYFVGRFARGYESGASTTGATTQPVALPRSPWHYHAARGNTTQPVAHCSLRSAQCALLSALCSLRPAHCALLNVLRSLRSARCALLNALNMPRAAFLCHGLCDLPRAAFLFHGLCDLPRGSCVTCHGVPV